MPDVGRSASVITELQGEWADRRAMLSEVVSGRNRQSDEVQTTSRTVRIAVVPGSLLARPRSIEKRVSELMAGATFTAGGDSACNTLTSWLNRTSRNLPRRSSKKRTSFIVTCPAHDSRVRVWCVHDLITH